MTTDIAFKQKKLYKLSDFFMERYKNINITFLKQDKKIINIRALVSLIFELIDHLINGWILYLLVQSAFLGYLLIGTTLGYINSLSKIKSNIQGVLGSISDIYQNVLYIKQLFDFLETPIPKDERTLEDIVNIDEISSIEFKNVSFKYPNSRSYAIQNVSFKIRKGDSISLVGENGSGKTTLVKLLLGLYDDFCGQILINDIPINKVNQGDYMKKIGILFQDYNKYELSCRENVALGDLTAIENDEILYESIRNANATDLINKLPQKIDTQLGVWFEKGVQLSGGQWQKIALTRLL